MTIVNCSTTLFRNQKMTETGGLTYQETARDFGDDQSHDIPAFEGEATGVW